MAGLGLGFTCGCNETSKASDGIPHENSWLADNILDEVHELLQQLTTRQQTQVNFYDREYRTLATETNQPINYACEDGELTSAQVSMVY